MRITRATSLFLAMIGCLSLAQSQSSTILHRPVSPIPSSLAGQQTPTRDSHAVQIIDAAVYTMGGQTAWRAITQFHSTWSLTETDSSETKATGIWDDDWSTGFLVFTHQLTNSSGSHTLSADRNHNVQDQEPSGTKQLPRKLQDIALPWALPAAILQSDIDNSSYKLEYLGLSNSSASVRITKIDPNGSADPYSIQVWQIDLSTGLPSELDFYTEDTTDHVPYPQSVHYSSYKQANGLTIPTVLLFNQQDQPTVFTLTSSSFN